MGINDDTEKRKKNTTKDNEEIRGEETNLSQDHSTNKKL